MKNKILYIAKYAPCFDNEFIDMKPEDILYAEYHQDIYNALKNNFDVASATDPKELIKNHKHYDYVFTLLNKINFRNSEIFISALCEYYKIPYLGAPPNIRAVAEDKHLAKLQAEHLNIKTAPWIIVNYYEKEFSLPFAGPYFIKPRYGATSSNIDDSCFCSNLSDVSAKLAEFQSKSIDVIIERYINGTTYTNGVLNNFNDTLVLPAVLEQGKSLYGLTTYREKRKIDSGLSRKIKRSAIADKIRLHSKNFFDSLKPMDYARFDYIVEEETNDIYFVEFNLCCNLGKAGAISLSATENGIAYEQLINNIVFSSLSRQKVLDCCDIYKL